MTENQRRAIDRLTKYRHAKKDIDLLRLKIDEVETRCNKQTRDISSIMQTKVNPDGSTTLVPVVVEASRKGNSAEDLVSQLIDLRNLYWSKCIAAEQLCMAIETEIGDYCDSLQARVLSLNFIYGKSLSYIARRENYSYSHVKRIRWQALEDFGQKMSPHEP